MKPTVYAIISKNGNIQVWSEKNEAVQNIADRDGVTVSPLYTRQQAALMVLDAIADARYTLPDFIIEEIKAKFGVEI